MIDTKEEQIRLYDLRDPVPNQLVVLYRRSFTHGKSPSYAECVQQIFDAKAIVSLSSIISQTDEQNNAATVQRMRGKL